MIIGAVKVHEDQQVLWPWVGDREITTAAVRNYAGEFFEEASRVVFGGRKHITSGQADICPDLSLQVPSGEPAHYLEVKSLRRGLQGLVYRDRLAKDRAFVRQYGCRLTYVLWCHEAAAAQCTRLHELRRLLGANTRFVLLIPLADMVRACIAVRPRIANYRLRRRNAPAFAMWAYRARWRHLTAAAGDVGVTLPTIDAFGVRMDSVVAYGWLGKAKAGDAGPPLPPMRPSTAQDLPDGRWWVRAGGDCVCEECGRTYYQHPVELVPDTDGLYLNRLCDGKLVKL